MLAVACSPVVALSGPAVAAPGIAEAGLIARDGARLPLRIWRPADGQAPRAILIALHGFNDYRNFFAAAGSFFAARGIQSYAYDQRGFGAAPHPGLWPGEAALVDDLKAAVHAARERHPGVPLYLLGESMGAAVIMTAMADPQPPRVDGVILVAPAVWGRASMPWYQTTALWLAVHTLPGGQVSGRSLGIKPSDNIEMLRALGRDPLVIKQSRVDAVYGLVNLMDRAMASAPSVRAPALILYGERDELIPPAAVREMVSRLPDAAGAGPGGRQRVVAYPDGYHMLTRDLQAETVLKDIAAWIADPEAPLPSGAEEEGAAAH
ncbi:MAG: lysophospholipase [Rhodospirillales bacterium]|nr:lysophospholipase [Rhodospirillales bacterium]